MYITKSKYKEIFAIEINTDKYLLKVLPTEGGKIVSFITKKDGFEYLVQNPCKNYKKLSAEGDFAMAECSGFDDMFPTIDVVKFTDENGRKLIYPDHGEVCRNKFDYLIKQDALEMRFVSETLGYEYVKTIREDKDGKIAIEYKIINNSDFSLDVLWAGHCLIKAENGGRVIVPFKNGDAVDLMFDTNGRFGKAKDRLTYQEGHLSTVWREKEPECRKFYFTQKCSDGYVSYQYTDGRKFLMEFDNTKIPYLGIWLNYGFLNGYYCIGLEPCSVGYDNVLSAKEYGQVHQIESKGEFCFSICLSVI